MTQSGKTIIALVLLLVLGLLGLWAYTSSQSKAQDDLAQPSPNAPKGKAKHDK